jgi:hypothetical protein
MRKSYFHGRPAFFSWPSRLRPAFRPPSGGTQGLSILAAGSPASQRITCDASAPVDQIEETVTAGSSSLSYDASLDEYVYVWKTEKAWAGTCRQLTVKLTDGTIHQANFTFTK